MRRLGILVGYVLLPFAWFYRGVAAVLRPVHVVKVRLAAAIYADCTESALVHFDDDSVYALHRNKTNCRWVTGSGGHIPRKHLRAAVVAIEVCKVGVTLPHETDASLH